MQPDPHHDAEAVARLKARLLDDAVRLEGSAEYAVRFGTPRSDRALLKVGDLPSRYNRNFAADLRALLARIEQLEAALGPFAEAAISTLAHFQKMDVQLPDHETISLCYRVGDAKALAAALPAKQQPATDQGEGER